MSADFTATYHLYSAAILRYCLWKSRDQESGQDLMQETFLRYWLCLQRKEVIIHARAFLYSIAHNLILDQVRKKKDASLEGLLEEGFEPGIDLWHQTQSRLDVERLLKTIGPARSSGRQLLQKRFMQGLTPAQIAADMGLTPNVVSVRIFRELKALRDAPSRVLTNARE